MNFSFSYLIDEFLDTTYIIWLWNGFLITLCISVCSIIFSTLLGIFLAASRESDFKAQRVMVTFYCMLFRNTPLLVQLFFWYFGSGQILPSSWMQWLNSPHELVIFYFTFHWPSFEFLSGLIGLTLYSSAFIAEEFRAGIAVVGLGQKNAAQALGLTHWQSMKYVILPQALRISLPPLLGQYMYIIKNSSLTMAIGVAELSYVSRQVETETLRTFQAFGVATFLYILLIALIEAWNTWYHQRVPRKWH
ncbi:amino acid ABC transporter permease [Candidatus Williamhamiltonella defendens]|uniref:amino acid ABC transporter permease n=1 Tax=Candidatus Williamhamiltonella defendens TaxID=138072 RepID=UPI00130E64D7|nr:amino acid ABC transporter permease [Candidatus Hamiltonella defensa]